MPNSEAIEKIKKLTDQEREVFKLFCEDLIYRDIGKELFIKETTVKKHMSNIRFKFGIDKMRKRKRDYVIRNKFCMALQALENQDQKKDIEERSQTGTKPKDSNDKQTTDAEIIEDDVPDEKTQDKGKEKPKADVSEEVEKKDDEKPLYQKKKKPLSEKKDGKQMKKTGQTKNDRFRSLKTIWRLISIAAIIFSGYMIYDHFFGSTPTQPAPSPEEPAVEQEQIAITDPEVIPTEVILPTVIPTSDEIIPTESPTYTPPAPPKPAFLFEDNFDTGLSEAWEIVSGNPIVVNGMLSADQVSWLMVGDPTWKNYSIEFNTDHPVPLLGSGTDFNAIGMRAQDIDNMYAFVWGQYQGESYIIEDGNWAEVPQSDYDVDDDETNLMLSVVNGQMTVYENGIKATSFFDTRFENGRIAVRIFSNAVIDDFKVKEILE